HAARTYFRSGVSLRSAGERRGQGRLMRRVPLPLALTSLLLGVTLAAAAIYGCHAQPAGPREPLLASFEDAADLARSRPAKGARVELSPLHATHGRRSLRLVLPHTEYPGLAAAPDVLGGWETYDTFRLEIFNPQPNALSLNVRIDDAASRSYATRYNEVFP